MENPIYVYRSQRKFLVFFASLNLIGWPIPPSHSQVHLLNTDQYRLSSLLPTSNLSDGDAIIGALIEKRQLLMVAAAVEFLRRQISISLALSDVNSRPWDSFAQLICPSWQTGLGADPRQALRADFWGLALQGETPKAFLIL